MMAPFLVMDRQSLTAPLGVRFWDVGTGTFVGRGLRVTAYPKDDRSQSTQAAPNRSGTYVLHHVSGLQDFEMGVGDPEFTELLPARHRFTVEVRDEERRFLPIKFAADLPCKGIFRWQTIVERTPLDLPNNSAGVPLYSSVVRAVPAGMAVLRAEIYEAASPGDTGIPKPAAWAIVMARFGGRLLGRGIADEHGRIALIFPYPAPLNSASPSGASPAGEFTGARPFLQQEWTIQLQAFYEPNALLSPPTSLSPPDSAGGEPIIPNLTDILEQSPVSLFLDAAQTKPLTEVTLMYGPKVLAPPSSSSLSPPPNPTPLSILFVSSAA